MRFAVPLRTSQVNMVIGYWRLLLTHANYKNNVRLPKIHKIPPEVDFLNLQDPSAKSESLAQSQSTMLRRITHMTMLSVVICVMNVWNQTSQAFVTCSCPYSDWLSKFVDRPQNVWSSNSCHVQACQDNMWANFWQFSTDSSSSCLNAWIDARPNKDAKLCTVAPSFCLPIRSTHQHIFEHVFPCRGSTMKFFARRLSYPGNFCCSSRNTWLKKKNFVKLFNSCFIRFAVPLRTSQVNMVKKRCWLVKINVFHQFLPHWTHILLLSSYFDDIHIYWQK